MRPHLDTTLEVLCGSRNRAALLDTLFGDSTSGGFGCGPLDESGDQRTSYWLRELGRITKMGFSGLYLELGWLELKGVIRRRKSGGATFVEVRRDDPLAQALYALVQSCREKDA